MLNLFWGRYLKRWLTNIYFCGDTWKLVQFFCLIVSGSAQIMETFSSRLRLQRFELH